MLPEDCKIMFSGDRFYGTADLVGLFFRNKDGSIVFSLKGNLWISQDHRSDKTLNQLKAKHL